MLKVVSTKDVCLIISAAEQCAESLFLFTTVFKFALSRLLVNFESIIILAYHLFIFDFKTDLDNCMEAIDNSNDICLLIDILLHIIESTNLHA